MFSSIHVGTFLGIRLFIHPTFWVLPLVFLLNQGGVATLLDIGFELALLFAVFTCVVLHEYGHAIAAKAFGIQTRDITLYPIGGVARLERISEVPYEELVISMAGPLVNLVIAIILSPVWLFPQMSMNNLPWNGPLEGLGWGELALVFIRFLVVSNLVLLLFNLLPIFPMDGGRVLRALLSLRLGFNKATLLAVKVGNIGAILIGFLAIFSGNFMLGVLALFVFLAGRQEVFRLYWQRMPNQPFSSQPAQDFPSSAPRKGSMVWDPNQQRWIFESSDENPTGFNPPF